MKIFLKFFFRFAADDADVDVNVVACRRKNVATRGTADNAVKTSPSQKKKFYNLVL